MGFIHPTAIIGDPPEHRGHIWTNYDGAPGEFLQPEIHPSAIVNAYVTVDAGIERPTRVGARSFLMKHVHVGHDVQIGANCEIAPGAVIYGHVVIGDDVRIGANAWIKNRLKIGDGAVIGASAAVTRDVPAGETWAGNPARKLEPKHTQMPKYTQMICGPRLTAKEDQAWKEAALARGVDPLYIQHYEKSHG